MLYYIQIKERMLQNVAQRYKVMSYFTRFNKGRRFDIDISDYEFKTLKECYDSSQEIFSVKGFFLNKKATYQSYYIVISGGRKLINMPASLNEIFDTIAKDEEAIGQIKDDKCKFKVREYYSETYKKTCYTIDFI